MAQADICARHGKRAYPDAMSAIHAALRSSKEYGKPFRFYGCVEEDTPPFHLTSEAKRGVRLRQG